MTEADTWTGPAVGFGGAEVHSLATLAGRGAGAPCFFGVDVELGRAFGAGNPGAAVFVRAASARLRPWTRMARPDARDVGVLRGSPAALLHHIVSLGAELAARGFVPVAIGCDHTVSYAHALGVCGRRAATYVYLDAHLDLGLHDDRGGDRMHNGNFVAALARANRLETLVNIGARSWTSHEPAYHDQELVTVIRRAEPSSLGVLAGREVYVSIDADVLDPAFVPNVSCPEPFGMTPRELLEIAAWLGQNCRVIGADVSELCPDPAHAHAAEMALRCVYELTTHHGGQ